jgi:hypothetical protein
VTIFFKTTNIQEIAVKKNIEKEQMITKMEVSSPSFTGRVPSLSSMPLMSLEEYIMIPNLIGTLS